MTSHLMLLETPPSDIEEEVSIGLDEDDITGIAWLQMPTETGFTEDSVTSPIEIINQFYYSDIVI